jgi:hypothetical protein
MQMSFLCASTLLLLQYHGVDELEKSKWLENRTITKWARILLAGIVQTKFAYIQMRWKGAKNKNKISLRYYIYISSLYYIATKEKKWNQNVVDCERAEEEQRP